MAEAKPIEQRGWDYPKHAAGRASGVVVHGDVAGVEAHRRNLTDWLPWMGLIDAGAAAKLDRYIGYYRRLHTSPTRPTPHPPPLPRGCTMLERFSIQDTPGPMAAVD